MTNHDLVSVVENAYRLDVSDRKWKTGILEQAAPLIDDGFGLAMFEVDPRETTAPAVRRVVALGDEPHRLEDFLTVMNSRLGSREVQRVYQTPFVYATASERMAEVYEDFRDDPIYSAIGHPHGVYDFVGVQIADPSGTVLILGAPRGRIEQTDAASRKRWGRLAAHIAAGYRLRRRGETGFDDVEVDAVLAPDGTMEEATNDSVKTPAMRTQLKEAAQAIDYARGEARRGRPDEALELWRALVRGTYSLVDKVDSDGRRFLLARRNSPQNSAPTGLSPRERQVVHYVALGHANQLIAYELGLAESTISTLLSRALRKLGLESRNALIELVHALGATQTPDECTENRD